MNKQLVAVHPMAYHACNCIPICMQCPALQKPSSVMQLAGLQCMRSLHKQNRCKHGYPPSSIKRADRHCQRLSETAMFSIAHLVALQLPYSWLVGKPGLEPTGTMSGFSLEVKIPAVQLKSPEVSDVFSSLSVGVACRLGMGVAKSWATRYTSYKVLAVMPQDPAAA